MEFDLVIQSILEHVFTSRLAFFRTTSGLVYICEYCEIKGILAVITECWKLPHGGNFRHTYGLIFFFLAQFWYFSIFGLRLFGDYDVISTSFDT